MEPTLMDEYSPDEDTPEEPTPEDEDEEVGDFSDYEDGTFWWDLRLSRYTQVSEMIKILDYYPH